MSQPADDKLPTSPGTNEAILQGKVVISDPCPNCDARFATPTGDVLTCLDCYTEFRVSTNEGEKPP